MAEKPRLYPVFLRLDGLKVVVVGGGNTAAAKVPALLSAGARVTVIAPLVRPEIRAHETVEVFERPFVAEDLDGSSYVVAAATSEVNQAVSAAAHARHLFVNAVDDVAHASAYLGGVTHRDGLTVAISTDGAAPALAGLLREALDSFLPNDMPEWVSMARKLREEWKAEALSMGARRPALLTELNRLYEGRTPPRGQA